MTAILHRYRDISFCLANMLLTTDLRFFNSTSDHGKLAHSPFIRHSCFPSMFSIAFLSVLVVLASKVKRTEACADSADFS